MLRLGRVHLPAKANRPNETEDHFPRKRNIESTFLAAFGLRDVEYSPPKIDVARLDLLQCGRPRHLQPTGPHRALKEFLGARFHIRVHRGEASFGGLRVR
jgi:hypothetical protein